MPVVRISDAHFSDLKTIKTWLGTDTPSQTIEAIILSTMERLGLERETDLPATAAGSGSEAHLFQKTPGLSFTSVIEADIDGEPPEKANWRGVLHSVLKTLQKRGMASDRIKTELQIPATMGRRDDDGFKFYPELGLSLQGQSAPDAWKEASRLADKFNIPVRVKFRWRENPKAQHPNQSGIVQAGQRA